MCPIINESLATSLSVLTYDVEVDAGVVSRRCCVDCLRHGEARVAADQQIADLAGAAASLRKNLRHLGDGGSWVDGASPEGQLVDGIE